MTNKLFLLVLINLVFLNLYSQFDFDWDTELGTSEQISSCIEFENIFICTKKKESQGFTLISGLKETGEVTEDLYINNNRSPLKLIDLNLERKFLLLSNLLVSNPDGSLDSNLLAVTIFDYELNIDIDTVYFLNDFGSIIETSFVLEENSIVLSFVSMSNMFATKNNFLRLDFDGNLVDHFYFEDNVGKVGHAIQKIEGSPNYQCFGPTSFKLDQDLNYISGSDIITDFLPSGNFYKSVKWRNGYLLGVNVVSSQFDFSLGSSVILYLNKNLEIITYNGIEGSSAFGTPFRDNTFTIANDSTIYLTNLDAVFDGNIEFKIAQFDKDLNKVWANSYSSESNYRYVFEGILNLDELHGFLIYGLRIDWQTNTPYGYLLKFDEKGNTTNTEESLTFNHSLFLAPNPAQNSLHIKTSSEMTKIRVYDSQGIELKALDDINATTNTVDIAELNKGFYFIHVEDIDGRITSKKFIKK